MKTKGTGQSTEGLETLTFVDPEMIICRLCGLLVGWSPGPLDPERPFVCVPCFDLVKIQSTDELGLAE